jgi:hypothetical protein
MKQLLTALATLMFFWACESDDKPVSYPKPDSLSYAFSFPTDERPSQILYNEQVNALYIQTDSKVEIYSKTGTRLRTIVDFEMFDSGNFERYNLWDITLGNEQNLFILAGIIITTPQGTFLTDSIFSVLQFNKNHEFVKEWDILSIDADFYPSAITYYRNHLYIKQGKLLRKLNLSTSQLVKIVLPVDTSYTRNTCFSLHTTDMEVTPDGILYLTGQARGTTNGYKGYDSVGCHISTYNLNTGKLDIQYGHSWTWECCAGFNNPGLNISREGFLYLASFYAMNIEIFNMNRNFILERSTMDPVFIHSRDTWVPGYDFTMPIDVVYADNQVFAADARYNVIHVFNQY